MIQTVNFSQFCDSFSGSYKDNFSYEGKRALFDYLEEYEQDTDEQIELDPIALCCDYSEYDSAYNAMEQFQPDDMPMEGEDGDDLLEVQEKNEAAALQWLQENTQVIKVGDTGRVIIQDF